YIRCHPISALFPYTTLFRSTIGSIFQSPQEVRDQADMIAIDFCELRDQIGLLAVMRKRVERSLDAALRENAVACVAAHLERGDRSEEHTSELQSRSDLVCRL